MEVRTGMTQKDFGEVADVLTDAFADYPLEMTFTAETLASLCRVDDVVLTACALAREPDDRLIGAGLGARRGALGRVAAMGVARAAHRRGIGQALGQTLLESLRTLGAEQVVLEALTVNTPAITLYEQGLGFARRRRLVGFTRADGGEPIPPAAWAEAMADGDEPDSWQLSHVVARAQTKTDLTFVPAVVPERHPVAHLLRDAGFAESEIDQYELERTL